MIRNFDIRKPASVPTLSTIESCVRPLRWTTVLSFTFCLVIQWNVWCNCNVNKTKNMDQCSNGPKNILVINYYLISTSNYQCLWDSDMKKLKSMQWYGLDALKLKCIKWQQDVAAYTMPLDDNILCHLYWGTCRMCCCCSSVGCLRGAAPCTIARYTDSSVLIRPIYREIVT